jgi:hypothetical protein
MKKRIEGLYPTMNEALQAADRLKAQGYSRNNITLVTNKEVQERFIENLNTNNMTEEVADDNTSNRTFEEGNDRSFWDSIKEAFTFDASDSLSKNEPLYVHRDAVDQGQVLVLVDDDSNTEIADAMSSNKHPNTIGAEDTRDLEDEQMLASKGEYLKDQKSSKDHSENHEQ